MRRRLTTALCVIALISASTQAAAGVRILCIGTGTHSEIEQIDQSAFYSAENHARNHHNRSGTSATKIAVGTDEKKSEGAPGFDIVLVDEWTGVMSSVGLLNERGKNTSSVEHTIIDGQLDFRPPDQRRLKRIVPPDYVAPPFRERLFDQLLL